MADDIAQSLYRLVKAAIPQATEAYSRLPRIEIPYVREEFEKFEYGEGNISSTCRYVTDVRKELGFRAHIDVMEGVIKKLPDWTRCRELLKAVYGAKFIEFHLERFVQTVIDSHAIGHDEERLVSDVCTFIRDMEESPLSWSVTAWLEGIWLADETYGLAGGITLRRTNTADFTQERPQYLLIPGWHEFEPGHPTAVITFSWRAVQSWDAQQEIHRMTDLLQLFRVGSVRAVRYTMSAPSFTRFSGIHFGSRHAVTTYKYKFTSADVESYNLFAVAMLQRLPPNTYDPQSLDPLMIALHRYRDALLVPATIENRIALAISCMEALCLKGAERSELTHRLSQRAAALLGSQGVNRLKAYNEITRGYDIRSSFIHGAGIEADVRASADKLCRELLEYARILLVIFLQATESSVKDKFIARIDNSLLDENARKKLEEELKGVVCMHASDS